MEKPRKMGWFWGSPIDGKLPLGGDPDLRPTRCLKALLRKLNCIRTCTKGTNWTPPNSTKLIRSPGRSQSRFRADSRWRPTGSHPVTSIEGSSTLNWNHRRFVEIWTSPCGGNILEAWNHAGGISTQSLVVFYPVNSMKSAPDLIHKKMILTPQLRALALFVGNRGMGRLFIIAMASYMMRHSGHFLCNTSNNR